MRHALEAEARRELEHYERLLRAHEQTSARAQLLTPTAAECSQAPPLLHRFGSLREAEQFEAQQRLKEKIERLQRVYCICYALYGHSKSTRPTGRLSQTQHCWWAAGPNNTSKTVI